MKKFFKFCKSVYNNFWTRLLFLLLLSGAIFAVGYIFNGNQDPKDALWSVFTDLVAPSIFLAAAASLISEKFISRANGELEESLKLEDDHHKIITKYWKHDKLDAENGKDLYFEDGSFMYLMRTPAKRRCPKNYVEDKLSQGYADRQTEIKVYFEQGKLYLSSLCIFANVNGDAVIRFSDSNYMRELPSFLRENAEKLLHAHGASNVSNNETIRLRDESYDDERHTLTLYTERSQYFYMLVTNRCMDYKISDGLTVRGLYEYGDKVSALPKSKLGNQIGINGLIFTRDGWLLLEKRGRKKVTWKNKFAQPISLAMKKSEVIKGDGIIPENGARDAFKTIILKTVLHNYGIGEEELVPFSIEHNFFGLARDLIEGGKPNLYFYVVVNKTAEELKEVLEERAKRACELQALTSEEYKEKITEGDYIPRLSRGKLESEYYLVKHDKITIDFGYRLKLKARDMLRVKRRFRPGVGRAAEAFDGLGHRMRKTFNASMRRECGEALLACLYFADVCIGRMKRAAAELNGEVKK